jgi:acyl-CoA reductase-like NAD-dependent aldehyde dehydrogenase
MRVWREEVFGPVLPILPFSTDEEAVELANDTEYGLSAYVYTTDAARYRRVAAQLKAGLIQLNNASGFSPYTPFGGYKKSGLGRQNGLIGFDEVTQLKVVVEEK